jgi:dephospho-CoA kinase
LGKSRNKPVIGIIGGVGAGKSTVARIFQDLGCALIDADALAHSFLNLPEVRTAICARWGADLRDAQGQIDRATLGTRVFDKADELRVLNALIHPHVFAEAERLLNRYQADDRYRAIVLDMPLLLEVGWDQRCDRIVFVQCATKQRKRHFQQKLGRKTADLEKREKVQISLDKKVARADNTVVNNSDLATLVRQVTKIFTDMKT